MKFGIVTLFPEMFAPLHSGITGRAIENKLVSLDFFNPRDFSEDKHHTVDDRPYGGGPGMVMMVKPVVDAISTAREKLGPDTKVLALSPQGHKLNQNKVNQLAKQTKLILVTGRYEGFDERIITLAVDEQVSIGDYVISGGELAAMVVIDAVTRQLPRSLGNEASKEEDSFMAGLLDHPHYTRPENFAGKCVPNVLLSGNHQLIQRWRLKQALGRTWLSRPDLLHQRELTKDETILLDEFITERSKS